jgi:hypothetical protein
LPAELSLRGWRSALVDCIPRGTWVKLGMYEYVSKPVRTEPLLDIVRQ